MLRQVTRFENGRGAFLSWVLTDELILSLQCGACYLHSRSHALKCSCHLRQWRSISPTHSIGIVNGEDGLGATISFKLDLRPRPTRQLQNGATIERQTSECSQRSNHVRTLHHVLIATNLHIHSHMMVHARRKHAQPGAKVTITNDPRADAQ